MEVFGISGNGIINSPTIENRLLKIEALFIRNGVPKYRTPITNTYGYQIKRIYKEVIIIFVGEYHPDNIRKKINFDRAVELLELNHIKFKIREFQIIIL